MADAFHVVCTHCDTVNRIPRDRPAIRAKCARCGSRLFEGHPVALDAARFRHHVRRSDIPVVADFWAAWCGPCRVMAPAFEQAAQALEPKARFVKVDVDAEPQLAAELGVQGIPALFLFKGGVPVARQAGAMPAAALRDWIERHAA